jgi:hypothetical protein
MRETQFRAHEHATIAPSGASIIVNPDRMDDLVNKLHHGDPTVGWEGDERLALAWNRETQKWELWRRERDEDYRLIALSPYQHPFPDDIIERLVTHDVRRGFDVSKYVREANAKVEKEQEYQLGEALGPSHEKLAWALMKDDRVGAGL